MFDCDEVLSKLVNYLDDEAGDGLRKQIEGHMAHCRTCRLIYDSTSKTLRIVAGSGSFDLPQNGSARVRERIKAGIRKL